MRRNRIIAFIVLLATSSGPTSSAQPSRELDVAPSTDATHDATIGDGSDESDERRLLLRRRVGRGRATLISGFAALHVSIGLAAFAGLWCIDLNLYPDESASGGEASCEGGRAIVVGLASAATIMAAAAAIVIPIGAVRFHRAKVERRLFLRTGLADVGAGAGSRTHGLSLMLRF